MRDQINRAFVQAATAGAIALGMFSLALAQVPAPAKPAAEKSVQIGGAAVGQFGHFVAVGWAKAMARAPGYRASPAATSGFVENAQLIAQKKMEFGWVAGLTAGSGSGST